jgi:hypothetical protein
MNETASLSCDVATKGHGFGDRASFRGLAMLRNRLE